MDPTRFPQESPEPSEDADLEPLPLPPGYVLREEVDRPRGPLRHERSLPLPLRVKSGSFREDRLVVETANEVLEVPWGKVLLVAVGMVEEIRQIDTSAYAMEKMMGGMSRMMRGGQDKSKVQSKHHSYVLDLYVEGLSDPLRFDSSQVNYRAFLGKTSVVSFQNFFRLVHEVANRAKAARFTPSTVQFVAWRRDLIHKFPALHEFEVDALNRLHHLDVQTPWEDLDLGRTAWAEERPEEWGED